VPKDTFLNLAETKRSHIANVALQEFSERSYDQVSISRLVARAGIAKGSFYQYFDNKLDLFRWLLLDVGLRAKLKFMQGCGAPAAGDFFAELEHLYLCGLRFGLTHPRLTRVAQSMRQGAAASPELAKLQLELGRMAHRNMKLLLQRAQERGQVRAELDVDLAADMLLAVSQQGLDQALVRMLGADVYELCIHPEIAERFSEAAQRALIGQIIDLLRRAFGSEDPAPSDRSVIALEEVADRLAEPVGRPQGGRP